LGPYSMSHGILLGRTLSTVGFCQVQILMTISVYLGRTEFEVRIFSYCSA
jgi:hypothetical protein